MPVATTYTPRELRRTHLSDPDEANGSLFSSCPILQHPPDYNWF